MPWKPGESGNPNGPQRGTRKRLTEAFLRDLEAHWRDNGKAIIALAAAEKPAEFTRMVSSLLPKQVEVERPLTEMSDDELGGLIATIREALTGADRAGSGSGVQDEPEQTEGVPTLQ